MSLLPTRNAALRYCTPLAREPISPEQAEGVSRMLKALADPVRLRLMSMILSHEGGEACAMCDLTEGFDLAVDPQPPPEGFARRRPGRPG